MRPAMSTAPGATSLKGVKKENRVIIRPTWFSLNSAQYPSLWAMNLWASSWVRKAAAKISTPPITAPGLLRMDLPNHMRGMAAMRRRLMPRCSSSLSLNLKRLLMVEP